MSETIELPKVGESCPHCGFKHLKEGGHLKYYVGALVCPVYVAMALDDVASWGVQLRRSPRRGRETRLVACDAPESVTCFHRGSAEQGGKRRCYSPDGFTTEVREEDKVRIVTHGATVVTAEVNEALLCKHIALYRRSPVRRSGKRARRHGSTPQVSDDRYPGMPGGSDPRKQAVYAEIWRRVSHLRDSGQRVTPQSIAGLAGKASWANGSDRAED